MNSPSSILLSPNVPLQGCSITRSRPPEELQTFVDNFQTITLASAGPLPRLLPGTGALCFFPLRGTITVSNLHERTRQNVSHPFLICNRHHVLDFSATEPVRLFVISFRPGRLRYFTSSGFIDLQDRISSINNVWGAPALRLAAKLSPAMEAAEYVNLVSDLLMQVLREKREARLDLLLDTLYLSPATRISDVADDAGWSLRHFERLFTNAYGVSPKFFARVTRLQRVARRLALDPVTSLSGSALDAGFFDQSHFVRELRRLAGLSPAELASGLRDRPHFYNPSSLNAYADMLLSVYADKQAEGIDAAILAACRARTLSQNT